MIKTTSHLFNPIEGREPDTITDLCDALTHIWDRRMFPIKCSFRDDFIDKPFLKAVKFLFWKKMKMTLLLLSVKRIFCCKELELNIRFLAEKH